MVGCFSSTESIPYTAVCITLYVIYLTPGVHNAWPVAVGKTRRRRRRLLLPESILEALIVCFSRQTTPVPPTWNMAAKLLFNQRHDTLFITPPRVYHPGDTLLSKSQNKHPLGDRYTLCKVYQTAGVYHTGW